jgi:hypothetical protein
MTTNKKSTAIAPTYTTRKTIAKKSRLISKSKPDTLQKTRIRNKTEYTGFFALITIMPASSAKLANM